MKRLPMLAAVGMLILGVPIPRVLAQQQTGFTVSFGGEMRLVGVVSDNMSDFVDTGKASVLPGTVPSPTRNKDSESFYFQRWRLRTTVESIDKKARAVWHLEVGDLFWGNLGGASGAEFGGATARVGNSFGGALGADGVNVETKGAYLQFDIPGIPNANLLAGIHNIRFLDTPAGGFLDDDGAGIQLNLKFDPLDLQLYVVKASENTLANADDNDLYAARLGVTLDKDSRLTLEGMIVNAQCFTRKSATGPPGVAPGPVIGGPAVTVAGPTTASGGCVSADFGETFWVGGTAATKIAGISLDGAIIYGRRELFSAPLQKNIRESGWGAQLVARAPVGPVQTWWLGRYTSGDDNRIAGGGCHTLPTAHPLCNPPSGPPLLPAGQDFSTRSFSTNLTRDSDKLPIIIAGTSWFTVPFIAEYIFGLPTLGAPGVAGATHYGDPSGTWTVGGSAILPLSRALALGAGGAFVAASEGTGVYGDHAVELDAGALYTYNANLSIQLIAGYVLPDRGDDAWGVTWRTRFAF